MKDRNGLVIEVGDWLRAVPMNPVKNRVPEARPVIGRVVSVYPDGERVMQWTPFGPIGKLKAGPYLCFQLTHADQFDPAEAEIILKWDGTSPSQNLPNDSLGGTSRALSGST